MAAKESSVDPVLAELTAIKRLLIFGLLRDGATQGQVASALDIDQSQISRMFPKGLGLGTRGASK